MINRRLHGRSDRGASLVEFAFVAPLLIMLVVGMAEFGLAFRDWLTISSASRQGARVGASAGTVPAADKYILDAVKASLIGVPLSSIVNVKVYKYGVPAETTTYTPSASTCGWTPCPDPAHSLYVVPVWAPAERNVGTNNLDTLGVKVTFSHKWITNILRQGASSTWTDDTIMRLEPELFS